MVTQKIIIFLTSTFIAGLFSCNIEPSKSWENFQDKYLIKEINNQSARGGNTFMYWKSQNNTFIAKEVISFASKKGWEFVDSMKINSSHLDNWNYNGKSIFPLSHDGFEPVPNVNHSVYEQFPRLIKSDLTVLMFKTDKVIIEPGTDEAIDINGFIIISRTGDEMSLYHLWGE